MRDIYKAFYNNTKGIIESQKAGGNSPENKINEIESSIRMMESIIAEDNSNEKG